MSAYAVEVENVSVSYGRLLALDDVSFRLHPGKVCVLVGANGSGKSTLLKAIIGMVRADGAIQVGGEAASLARRSGRVAYLPQSEDVDPTFPLDVSAVVAMGRYRRSWSGRGVRDGEMVERALDAVGLSGLASRQIGRLSGGQRKRAFLARCLAQEAELLLLDEPFAGVDTDSQRKMMALLAKEAALGKTVLMATHQLDGLSGLIDEAIVIDRRLVSHGAPGDLPELRGFDLPGGRDGT